MNEDNIKNPNDTCNRIAILKNELTITKENSIKVFRDVVNNISNCLLEEAERGDWDKEFISDIIKEDNDKDNLNLGVSVPKYIDLSKWQTTNMFNILKDSYAARLIINISFHFEKITKIICMLLSDILKFTKENDSDKSDKLLDDFGRIKPISINYMVNILYKAIEAQNIEVDMNRLREIINNLETEWEDYTSESIISDWFLDNIVANNFTLNNTNHINNFDESDNHEPEHLCELIGDIPNTTNILPVRDRPLKEIAGINTDKIIYEKSWEKEKERTGFNIHSFNNIWTGSSKECPYNIIINVISQTLPKYIIPLRDVFNISLHIKAHIKCAKYIFSLEQTNNNSSRWDKTVNRYKLPEIYSKEDTWLDLENIIDIYAHISKIILNIYNKIPDNHKISSLKSKIYDKDISLIYDIYDLLKCIPIFMFDHIWMINNCYTWPYTHRNINNFPSKCYLSKDFLLRTAIIFLPNTINTISNKVDDSGIIYRQNVKSIENTLQIYKDVEEMFNNGFFQNKKLSSNEEKNDNDKNHTDINDFILHVPYKNIYSNNPYIIHPIYFLKIIYSDKASNMEIRHTEEVDQRYNLSTEDGTLITKTATHTTNSFQWCWRSLPLFKVSLLKNTSSSLCYKFWEISFKQIFNDSKYTTNPLMNQNYLERMITIIEDIESSTEKSIICDINNIKIQNDHLEMFEKQEDKRIRNIERCIFNTILCEHLLNNIMIVGN
uniref:Wsv220-like protein n=1 Tax=Trachysalambria curvirostris majanivirus TaxID=2984281 RepID=A0A9C7CE27_9VIRU|nr:MAG: wsv220-like protein [Trachysalambria curvirostris majanivirus]